MFRFVYWTTTQVYFMSTWIFMTFNFRFIYIERTFYLDRISYSLVLMIDEMIV